MSYQYIYLIQTREFVNSKEPVYKIGKSTKINFTRFLQYPKESVQIFQSSCYNCHVLEKIIIKQFHAKYHHCKIVGKEYFKGNVRHMVNDICQLILLEKQEETTKPFAHEVVTNIIHDIIRNVLDNVSNEIGVETIISPTSEIIEATEVSVKLEPTESDIIHDIIRNVLDYIPKDIGVEPIILQNLVPCGYFCCVPCGYFCKTNSNLTKHKGTKKHIDKIQNPDAVEEGEYKCKNCVKTYRSHQGLWIHKKKCKTPETKLPVSTPEVDLHAKIDNLERIILEMANNQQPTTINNSINNDNN